MSSRYDSDNDLQDLHDSDPQDREISLGTTTILGIFFALALLCGVFFGFGYSLGRHSAPPVPSAVEAVAEPENGSSKPSSGSRQNQESSASQPADAASEAAPHDDSAADASDKTQQEPPPVKTPAYASASETRAATTAKTPAARADAVTPESGATSPGSTVVQVAAVSHQDDANMLANALKQRGYSVSIRQMPQDKLLHIQVGPFATKRDADTMRQRLQADGYNAIVK